MSQSGSLSSSGGSSTNLSFVTDSGTAVSVAGVISLLGGDNISTSGAGSTVLVDLTLPEDSNFSILAITDSNVLSAILPDDVGKVLTSNGVDALPTWQDAPISGIATIDGDTGSVTGTTVSITGGTTGLLTSGSGSTLSLAGTLVVANGGTGATTLTGLLLGNGTSAVSGVTPANQSVLTSSTLGVPSWTSLATDGKLIIGSTAGNPTAATLTQGTGITVTNASNSITIAVDGSVVGKTLTGDSGGALSPTAGNWNVLGQQAGTIAVMDTVGSGSTLQIEDRTWTTPLIVDPSATVGLRGTYQTITAAIAAASSNQSIFVRPGTYTEDFTVDKSLTFFAYSAGLREVTQTSTIRGKVTISGTFNAVFNGFKFTTFSDNSLVVSGNGAIVSLQNCYFNVLNAISIVATGNASTNVYIENGGCSIASTYTLFTTTNASVWIKNCTFYDAVTPASSTTSTGTVYVMDSRVNFPLASTSSGTFQITNSKINPTNLSGLTTAGTGTSLIEGSEIYGGTASAISVGSGTTVGCYNTVISSSNTNAITGAGTFKYSNLSFISTSNLNNVTTQTPIVTSNDAIKVTTPGAYPYTVIPQDGVILVDTASARTINLNASPVTGQIYRIKDYTGSAASNNITVTPSAGTIDGLASYVINMGYGSIDVVYSGSSWVIL